MAKRSTPRKRRAPRSRTAAAAPTGGAAPADAAEESIERGYARSRRRDEEARAALKPLAEGERPGAVTVGAVAAGALSLANLVALIVRYDPNESRQTAGSVLATAVLALVAVGMWKARYWAVLGMQALLAITLIAVSLELFTVFNVIDALICLAILGLAGTLFWKLVRAMARIQMPERPGADRR
jgi:hypothetical protein